MNPKIEKFIHDNKEYEIRGDAFNDGFQAAVFHDGNKLCQNVKISFETDGDLARITGERGFDLLFRLLEDEVKHGRLGG